MPSWARWFGWIAVASVVFAVLLPLDAWIAMWLDIDTLPGDLVKAINLMELFGHGMGAVLVVAGVMVLLPERLRDALRLAFGMVLAGLLVNLVKLFVFRYRPGFFYPGFNGDERSWIGTAFSGVGAGHEDALLNSKYLTESFPSGHSANAVALAVMMSIMFPRGRYLFGVLAALSCLQRVMGHAHWASDTVAGAVIGMVCGIVAFRLPWPGPADRNRMAG